MNVRMVKFEKINIFLEIKNNEFSLLINNYVFENINIFFKQRLINLANSFLNRRGNI